MKKFFGWLTHKWHTLQFLAVQDGWRSYTRLNQGKWNLVKLPRERWQRTFCADPFLFRHQGTNYLFFETMTWDGKGMLGCAKEVNGKWKWLGIALEESWHLSYPQVFEEAGKIYMIPESCRHGRGDVCLYEAVAFPLKWRKIKTLINEPFADSTLLKKAGHYYLACYNVKNHPKYTPELWHAEALEGPWSRHPCWNGINASKKFMRCGGRFVEEKGMLYRIAQDCDGYYGIRIWKIPVEEISPLSYLEGEPSVLIDVEDEPRAMKHTYNRIEYDGQVMEVVDIHWDVLRPLPMIVRNFCQAIIRKFK